MQGGLVNRTVYTVKLSVLMDIPIIIIVKFVTHARGCSKLFREGGSCVPENFLGTPRHFC